MLCSPVFWPCVWYENNDKLKYMFAHKNTCTDTHTGSVAEGCVCVCVCAPSPCASCLPLIGSFAAELSHWNTGCNSFPSVHPSIHPSVPLFCPHLHPFYPHLRLCCLLSEELGVFCALLHLFLEHTEASGVIQNKIEIGVLVKAFQLFWIQWARRKSRCFALMSATLEELAVESEINRLWIWIFHINAKCDTSFLAANLCEHTKFNHFFRPPAWGTHCA